MEAASDSVGWEREGERQKMALNGLAAARSRLLTR